MAKSFFDIYEQVFPKKASVTSSPEVKHIEEVEESSTETTEIEETTEDLEDTEETERRVENGRGN